MFYFDKLAYKGKLTKEYLDWFVILDKKKKITNRAKSWSIWSHSFHWTDLICIFPEKKKKSTCQFHCSVTELCPILCNPTYCSTPGFPVLPYLPEFAQIHVLWVGVAIQPSHPILPSSLPTFNLSQNQGLFHSVSSSNQVAKALERSFSISPSNEYSGLISF